MDARYANWIASWLTDNSPKSACVEATEQMAAAFPELQRVRGHVTVSSGRTHPHWWLVTPDGSIIDPTASQWTPVLPGVYEPLNEETFVEPTGRCPNCGNLFYGEAAGGVACSAGCADAYAAWCLNPL